jgi:ABC-2 type transport system permease protein
VNPKILLVQIRREFWEHRVLVLFPLALCVIFVLLCLLFGARIPFGGIHVEGQSVDLTGHSLPAGFSFFMHMIFTTLLYLLMALVAIFYLGDCLYTERKDRSILFWKSLPVSDAMTVISKLLVALVAVPLVVFVLSLVTNLIASVIFRVSYTFHDASPGQHFTWLEWLQLNGVLFVDIFVLALWYAPIAAYQLLVSAWARRAAILWTVLPPVILILGERMFLGSWHVWEFARYRLGWVLFDADRSDPGNMVERMNAIPMLAEPGLWIGVAIAAALVYATIRIRRHRDDT